MAIHRIYAGNPPTFVLGDDGPTKYSFGLLITTSAAGEILGGSIYRDPGMDAGADAGTLRLYTQHSGTGSAVSKTFSISGSGWIDVLFDTPFVAAAGDYNISYEYDTETEYVSQANFHTAPIVSGPVTAITDAGRTLTGGGDWAPDGSWQNSAYGPDIIFDDLQGGGPAPVLRKIII